MTGPRRAGFTLVEVVVGFLLLAVATAGTTGILLHAARTSRDADHRERLLWAATELADSLAGVPSPGPGTRELPDGSRLEWDEGWVEVRIPPGVLPWVRLPLAPARGRTMLGAAR
jgi:type II secretory pathway pseudopilin PulG